MKRLFVLLSAALGLSAGAGACGSAEPDPYRFDGSISRDVLDRYLSRAVTMSEFLTVDPYCNDGTYPDKEADVEFIRNTGAKFIGRAIYRWGDEKALAEPGFWAGAEALIDRVHALGMDFGLWVEPESVNPDSDLYRTHPDWIHKLDGREPLTQRNQYLLDFGKPEVERFALDMLRGLLNTYAIRYLKWDMNRAMTDVCESLTPFARERHVLALYRILDALEKEFPDVDIEACSGGGARVDLGMAKRTAQFWVSDNTDPFDRLFIQEGYTLMYAPMMMSCWVTDTPADGRRRGRADWRYKFHAAMCGTLGVGADISKLSDEEMALFTAEIARYKTWRHVVQNGDLYRLQRPSGGNVAATEYVSKDQNEAVLFLFMHSRKCGEVISRVRLRALREDARYFCVETGKTYAGRTLMHLGLSAELNGDFDSGVFYFQAVKEGYLWISKQQEL